MRLLFFGSGAFGLPTLAHLHEAHDVVAVVSQPARPAGRKRVLTPTPVAAWARERGLPVHEVADVNTNGFVDEVAAYGAEASVVIAFGQKLGPALLEAMGALSVNLHGSLLPAYRGAAPIQRAVRDGQAEAGVSVISLADRMDAGLVYGTARLKVEPTETSGELHDRLAALGPAAVGGVLERFAAGTLVGEAQDEARVTQARKLKKPDGTVDFDAPAEAVRARVNGLNSWPGCRVVWEAAGGEAGELLLRRVGPAALDPGEALPAPGVVMPGGRVACADGVVALLEVQAPGRGVVVADAYLRSSPLAGGGRLMRWEP